MKRIALAGFVLIGLALVPSARAETRVGVNIFLGNAPPPPAVVFREEPRFVVIPDRRVYVVEDEDLDYDMFRYGAYFYIYDNDCWYRSRSYRGPFLAIRAAYVPQPIYYVSDQEYHWRHHPRWMPPGQARKEWREDHGRN